jgi:hypothetical protein
MAPAHRYDRFCANLPYGPDYVTDALVKRMAEPMVEHLNALLDRQYLAELVPVRDAFQALIEHRDARRKDALRRSLTVVENEETN